MAESACSVRLRIVFAGASRGGFARGKSVGALFGTFPAMSTPTQIAIPAAGSEYRGCADRGRLSGLRLRFAAGAEAVGMARGFSKRRREPGTSPEYRYGLAGSLGPEKVHGRAGAAAVFRKREIRSALRAGELRAHNPGRSNQRSILSRTLAVLCSRVSRSVWHSTSAASGGSYGSSRPVTP